MPDEFFYNSLHVKIPYKLVRMAMRKEKVKFYKMSLVGAETDAVVAAVNQGIDAHLEACSIKEQGDVYKRGVRKIAGKVVQQTLECKVSPKSLPTLLRRLTEPEHKPDDVGISLVEGVLTTLGINEMGEYVGSEALGV
jgi:hypothetical protein